MRRCLLSAVLVALLCSGSTVGQMSPGPGEQPLPESAKRFLGIYFETDLLPSVEQYGEAVGMDASDIARCRELLTKDSPGYVLDDPNYYCVSLGVLASGVKE